MKHVLLMVTLLSGVLNLTAQERQKVYLTKILEEAIFSDKEEIVYENIELLVDDYLCDGEGCMDTGFDEFGNEKDNFGQWFKRKHPNAKVDSTGKLILQKKISITDFVCNAKEIYISNLVIENPFELKGQANSVYFTENSFSETDSIDAESYFPHTTINLAINEIYFEGNIFERDLILEISEKEEKNSEYHYLWFNQFKKGGDFSFTGLKYILISGNKFNKPDNEKYSVMDSTYYELTQRVFSIQDSTNQYSTSFSFDRVTNVEIDENEFLSESSSVSIEGNCNNLSIGGFLGNRFESQLKIRNLVVQERFVIKNTEFLSGIAFGRVLFPELYLNIQWDPISNGDAIYFLEDLSAIENIAGFHQSAVMPYLGKSDKELSRKNAFRELIGIYSKLYRNYKEWGDIRASNAVYVKMQELYTGLYSYLYRTEGGLQNYFRWRLNQLLKFYTEYGTDPAKALVISFYILIGFAVFYFFFPSEWDVTSKARIVANMRSAIDKKQSGTFVSVMKALWLILLSFVNALMLSLNSFVTLGFGTIPTTGLARYVCILQGFMGWFLLSIFTVALINQVIF